MLFESSGNLYGHIIHIWHSCLLYICFYQCLYMYIFWRSMTITLSSLFCIVNKIRSTIFDIMRIWLNTSKFSLKNGCYCATWIFANINVLFYFANLHCFLFCCVVIKICYFINELVMGSQNLGHIQIFIATVRGNSSTNHNGIF